MACLLYGAGLRVLECCHLRIQDLGFASNQIVVRSSKGNKDRVTMLPAMVKADLAEHLRTVRSQHDDDLPAGSSCRRRSSGSIRRLGASGPGSGYAPPRGSTATE